MAVDPSIHTLQVRPCDMQGTPYEGSAIMELGGSGGIVVSFDQLADDRQYMRYELIHCDSQWRPESIVDSQYLDGFNQAEVADYEFSQATLMHYVNYRITLPSEQMSPTISGNYLVRVYPEDDPEETLLQARFSVTEATANVSAEMTSLTDFDANGSHQQLTIRVDTQHLPITNPITDLRVVVEQDSRTDNAVTVTTPLRMEGKTAVFEHLKPLTFKAGNEYRRFEIISERYPGMGVEHIVYAYPLYHYELGVDYPRSDTGYAYDLSRYGRYVIRQQDARDSDTQADYGIVHFTLQMPELRGYDVHIEGDITGRTFGPESHMVYDRDAQCYRKDLLLKQGAYSYQYVAVPRDGTLPALTAPVEGDFYQTGHTYIIKVYYRKAGEMYDRLAGVCII